MPADGKLLEAISLHIDESTLTGEFVERWGRENGEYGVEKIIQGSRTESVPMGELKNLAMEQTLF